MPLPDRGSTWPPPALDIVYDAYRQWDAWYVGDPDGLRAYYGANTNPAPAIRPSQYAGGIVGRASRWLWGDPPEPGALADNRIHVPVAADIAATSADLLFGEQIEITSDDTRAQQRLAVIADDGMHAKLVESAEISAALSGVYLRVVWDKTLADKPWLDAVHPDAAVPEWRWGRLAAVVFWHEVGRTADAKTLRLLERHEPGRIEYGLYAGDRRQLGMRVPLADSPATENLARLVDAASSIGTGADGRLTAAYVPNVRPSRKWRNIPGAAQLGRSDLDGIEPLMDALDRVYSSWMNDVRVGKGRILVPGYMLESRGAGQGATFNLDRSVYQALNVEPGGAQGVQAEQFEIRVEEHQQTAQAILEAILRTAGYSAQTFGLSGDVAVTATEVNARERRSFITRDKKIRYWRPALAEILETLLLVDRAQFGTQVPDGVEVTAHFADGVSDSIETLARTADMLHRAEAASIETLVRMLHPDWEDTDVAAEVARIKADRGSGEDPERILAGFAGNNPPGAGELDDQGEGDGRLEEGQPEE